MYASTRQNLPTIAAGLLAGESYGSIGRRLGLTPSAVVATTQKYLPGLAELVSEELEGAPRKKRRSMLATA